jgi:LacI family transcriptional regulator
MHERVRGYKDALLKNKIELHQDLIKEVAFSNAKTEVATAIDQMLTSTTPVDAILFCTYSLAINGLKHINHLQLKVPDDIAIVSFGQAEAFDLYYRPITFVRQQIDELGKAAVNILVTKIKNPQEEIRHILIEAQLVERDSSRPKKMQ